MAALQRAGSALAPATLRELRDAALADEHGNKLRAALAQHALAWRTTVASPMPGVLNASKE
jgi:indolepyruvate ferredoxin oxidoreductase beta subunit